VVARPEAALLEPSEVARPVAARPEAVLLGLDVPAQRDRVRYPPGAADPARRLSAGAPTEIGGVASCHRTTCADRKPPASF
jgi:hypothetical protein